MRIMLFTLLVVPFSLMAETATIDLSKIKLPAKVVKAQERLDRDLTVAAEKYRKAVELAKSKAMKSMLSERRKTKDALVALAIQTEVDKVEEIGAVDIFGEHIVEETELNLNRLIGNTYNVTKEINKVNEIWQFADKGILMIGGRDWDCKWKITGKSLNVTFNNNTSVEFKEFDIEKNLLPGDGSGGKYTIIISE